MARIECEEFAGQAWANTVRVICKICGEGKNLPQKDVTYFSIGTHFFCKEECLTSYLRATLPKMECGVREAIVVPDEKERMSDGTAYSHRLGSVFRSGYEAQFAEFYVCDRQVPLYYEPFMVKVGEGKHYIPDFYFPDSGIFVEVKGQWLSGSKKKFQRAMEVLGPDRLILVPPLYRNYFKCKNVEKTLDNF